MSHDRVFCGRCGVVVMQCRCPGPHFTRTVNGCSRCMPAPVPGVLPAKSDVKVTSRVTFDPRPVLDEIAAEWRRAAALYPDCVRLPNGTGASGYKTFERIAKQSCERAYREGRITHAHIFEEEAAETDAELRKELVQAAAMALKWVLDIDQRATEAKVGGVV